MRNLLLAVLILLSPASLLAQTTTYAEKLSIGALPHSAPASGTTVRMRGLGARTTGQDILSRDADGNIFAGPADPVTIPSSYVQRNVAETITSPWTFTSILTAPSIRGTASPFLIRNAANSATIASFADAGTSLTGTLGVSGATTLSSTLGVTGLATFSGNIRANASPLTIRNAANSATIATFGDAGHVLTGTATVSGATTLQSTLGVTGATTLSSTLGVTGLSTLTGGFTSNAASNVNAALTITGLTTAAKIRTTGVYGVADPLTFFATDSTTPLAYLYNAGRNVVTNSGNDTVWEYHGLGNPSGSRVWRAGNIGGSYLIQSGNDAASVWTNLARSTMDAGVPNGWYWGTGVQSVTPDLDFTTNLGEYPTQYANMWVRNLWATTLVAQDVISTIGGAVLVTPTTTLEAPVSAGDTTFQTAHNEMVANDIAYINDNLATEYVQVTAGPLADSSSISYVGENEAVGATVTLPTHQAGDLLLIFAFRNATTAPTLPADWISLCTASGTGTSIRVGYRIAPGAGTASGTWTNATSLMSHVYRSSAGNMPAPGACAHNAATSTSMVYPALTLSKTDHSSWVARAAIASAGTNIQTVPSGGFTLRSNNSAVPETASFDTNGRLAATSIAASSAITITSANWRTVTVEIVGIGLAPFSYTVTRGYGGVFAARSWPGGVSLANTGTTGDGGINMYAIQSIKGSGEQGPTVQGYERTSSTYNALSTRWALGNLRGLYNYGATDTYGAAFGNAADVWVGIDATNGVRFFDAGTTVNAHFATNGSILLGQTGAGQENVYIDNTQIQLRQGTVNLLRASTANGLQFYDDAGTLKMYLDATNGIVVGDTSGTNTFAQVTNTSFSINRGIGNPRLVVNATGVSGVDNGGVERFALTTTGLTLGVPSGTAGNVLLASDGNLYLRSGTTNRVHVGLYGVVLNDTLGTMRGYIGDKTSLGIGTLAGYGFLFGGTASGQSHIEYGSTTGNLRLCNSGTNCVFELQGSTGNITSTGSILLATGGSVTSTGNWSLTATAGLSFSASASSGGDTSRSVQWSNGFKMFAYSNGLWIDCASCGADGLTVNDPTQITGLLTVGSTASGAGAKIRPAAISLSDAELGESGREWDRIWSTLPTTTSAAYPIVQMSNQLQQKTNGFNGTLEYTYGIYVCSITVQYGILVGTPSCI